MGNSASAALFFGSPFESEDDEGSEWEERFAAASGILPPSEPYGDGSDNTIVAKYHAYWDLKNKLVREEPCAIGWAGTYDESSYYVYLKASKTSAEWGPPVPVITQEVTPDQIMELVKFCQLLGISHGTFGWYLAAFYG